MSSLNLDEKWMNFLKLNGHSITYAKQITPVPQELHENKEHLNEATILSSDHIVTHDYELSISTKTKVLFLNSAIDINNIFWKIPIVEYWNPQDGVIKKQMKIVSKNQQEYQDYLSKLDTIGYYTENIIKQINNPTARSIKFKDERKITIGISKKDILTCRSKRKNAFYNCFALIVRFKFENIFKEVHVKVFNTGKMEIPGIVDSKMFENVKVIVLEILQKYSTPTEVSLDFIENINADQVLINSNFNCGFCIKRDSLHSIIMSAKYDIESSYDPCSYPGVKCKYYFNNDIGFDIENQKGTISKSDANLKMHQLCESKKYTEVSFMIFRTGSCLIVGNCSERILRFIFDFIKKLLTDEFHNICVINEFPADKKKSKKIRKKNISLTNQYYKDVLIK
jgi:hypothetical protein